MSLSRRVTQLEAPVNERSAKLHAAWLIHLELPDLLTTTRTVLDPATSNMVADLLQRQVDTACYRLTGSWGFDAAQLEALCQPLPDTPDIRLDAVRYAGNVWERVFDAVEARIGLVNYERWLSALQASGEQNQSEEASCKTE